MNAASGTLRNAVSLIVPVLVMSLGGCTDRKDTPVDSVGAAPAVASGSIELPPGVPSNPAQFLAQVQTIAVGITHTRSREAVCAGCSVNVYVETLYATPINLDNPGAGTVSARFTNLDSVNTEKMYGLKPSTQAKYFMWVDAAPSTNRARWTLLEVPSNPAAGLVTATHQGRLSLCAPNTPGQPMVPEVDFVNFKHPQGCTGGGGVWVLGPAPIWKKCSTGCCISAIGAMD